MGKTLARWALRGPENREASRMERQASRERERANRALRDARAFWARASGKSPAEREKLALALRSLPGREAADKAQAALGDSGWDPAELFALGKALGFLARRERGNGSMGAGLGDGAMPRGERLEAFVAGVALERGERAAEEFLGMWLERLRSAGEREEFARTLSAGASPWSVGMGRRLEAIEAPVSYSLSDLADVAWLARMTEPAEERAPAWVPEHPLDACYRSGDGWAAAELVRAGLHLPSGWDFIERKTFAAGKELALIRAGAMAGRRFGGSWGGVEKNARFAWAFARFGIQRPRGLSGDRPSRAMDLQWGPARPLLRAIAPEPILSAGEAALRLAEWSEEHFGPVAAQSAWAREAALEIGSEKAKAASKALRRL